MAAPLLSGGRLRCAVAPGGLPSLLPLLAACGVSEALERLQGSEKGSACRCASDSVPICCSPVFRRKGKPFQKLCDFFRFQICKALDGCAQVITRGVIIFMLSGAVDVLKAKHYGIAFFVRAEFYGLKSVCIPVYMNADFHRFNGFQFVLKRVLMHSYPFCAVGAVRPLEGICCPSGGRLCLSIFPRPCVPCAVSGAAGDCELGDLRARGLRARPARVVWFPVREGFSFSGVNRRWRRGCAARPGEGEPPTPCRW